MSHNRSNELQVKFKNHFEKLKIQKLIEFFKMILTLPSGLTACQSEGIRGYALRHLFEYIWMKLIFQKCYILVMSYLGTMWQFIRKNKSSTDWKEFNKFKSLKITNKGASSWVRTKLIFNMTRIIWAIIYDLWNEIKTYRH